MGYYTKRMLVIHPNGTSIEAIAAWAKEHYDDDYLGHLIEKGQPGDGVYYSETKWYAHDDHMRDLSRAFPKARFVVLSQGEDWYDLPPRVTYFGGGELHDANVDMPTWWGDV